MVEKETSKFSRESFKEKILRQIEEENKASQEGTFEHYARSAKKENFDKPEHPERQVAADAEIVRPTAFPRISELVDEPEKFSDLISPQVTEPEVSQAVVEPEVAPTPETQAPLRDRLEAIALSQTPKPTQSFSRRSRSERRTTAEQEEPEFQAPTAPVEPVRRRRSEASEPSELENPKIAAASPAPTSLRRGRPEQAKDEEFDDVPAKSRKPKTKKKRKSTAGKIIAVIVVVFLLAAAGTGWYGYNFVKSSVKPLNPADHTVKAVNIPAGSSSKQIGDILEKQGIIKNGMVFQYYTKFKNYTGFKSGYYNLAPDMSLSKISELLEKGGTPQPVEPVLGKITIPEGYTIDQIATAVTQNADDNNAKTPFSKAEFLKVVQDPTFIAQEQKAYPQLFASLPAKSAGVKYQLEGYLFPATYDYTKKSTMKTIVASMITAMDTQLKPFYAQMASNNLTVNQVLSLAALVEKEANNDEDRRNVAGVFFNRIAQAMPLDSNVSVLYAESKLGSKTTLKEDASIDTNYNSPFNLYLNTGTGPGPVDSPSLSSIKAVISPAQNSYLYFVADVTTGKVYFAETLDQQNANIQTYVDGKISASN